MLARSVWVPVKFWVPSNRSSGAFRANASRRALMALPLALLLGTFACAPTIDAQLDEAQSLVAEGQPMAALPLLERVVQRRPKDGPANLLLGQVLLQVGRTRTAFPPLQRALETERWAVPAGLLLASAHLSEGHPRPALAAVNRVLATHPDQASALRIRATAHLQIGSNDEALADARRILEVAPDDSQAPILAGTALTRLGRLDEAEAMLRELETEARASQASRRHSYACAALASFLEAGRHDSERATAAWRDCLDLHPTDPAVLTSASTFFDRHGDPESSLAALRRGLEHDPSALGIRIALARRLAAGGDTGAGDRLLVEAAEETSASGTAGPQATTGWRAVASFRQQIGDSEGTRAALERAIQLATEDELDPLRFQRAMLLLDLGHLDEAREAHREIGSPALADLLEGRLLLLGGSLDEAVEAFARSLAKRPRAARAHYLMGVAAQAQGRVDAALEAWGRAAASDPSATDAALAAARLRYALGQPALAVELLRLHRARRGSFERESNLLEIRSIAALGQKEAAIALLEGQLRGRPDPGRLAVLAELLGQTSGPEAGVKRIDQAVAEGFDLGAAGALPVLRIYALQALAADRPEVALAAVARARRARPEAVGLAVLEAVVQEGAGDPAAAEASLRRVVADEPDDPRALSNLGIWLHGHGQKKEALPLLRRATRLAPDQPEAAYLLAQILSERGEAKDAERALRALVAAAPLHVGACNDLAWLLAEAGRDLDLALQLAQRAARLRPEGATLDTLGWVRLARGEIEEALNPLSQAVALEPGNPGFRYRLGVGLARVGRNEDAREAFEAALGAGTFPEAEKARSELARLGD